MPVLSDLEPREVFAWFERLCAIPHGSHHAKAISDYLVAFARERGLACRQDAANYVVIRKAASAGYENAPVVMLQGHIDMVCEKDADCGKDMETEGLDLFTAGVASLANIGGTASASVLAGSCSGSLVPVGILMALMGYVVGTPLAVVCAHIMESLA